MAIARSVIVVLVLLLSAISAEAHDYWFMTDGDDYLLHRGHRYSQHGGEKEVPFDPAIITATYCLGRGDTRPRSAEISSDYPARVKGPCLAVLVTADSGYWSQTLTGTKNQSKNELYGVLRSWQARESMKRVEAWDERLRLPLSDELELVFSENPFDAKPGDKLRLVAVLGGKPVQGVTVAYDGDPRGVTGADGKVNLRVRHPGMQVITASLERPLDNAKADKLVRSTVLMFELPQR